MISISNNCNSPLSGKPNLTFTPDSGSGAFWEKESIVINCESGASKITLMTLLQNGKNVTASSVGSGEVVYILYRVVYIYFF